MIRTLVAGHAYTNLLQLVGGQAKLKITNNQVKVQAAILFRVTSIDKQPDLIMIHSF